MKKLLTIILLASWSGLASASAATDFAQQAATISGVAAACGQDVATFNSRVLEAINTLAIDNTDAVRAQVEFQQTNQAQFNAQKNNNLVPCQQVLQEYNSLPLLRDDYKETVLAKLKDAAAQSTSAANAPTNVTQPPANPNPAAANPALPVPGAMPGSSVPVNSPQQ